MGTTFELLIPWTSIYLSVLIRPRTLSFCANDTKSLDVSSGVKQHLSPFIIYCSHYKIPHSYSPIKLLGRSPSWLYPCNNVSGFSGSIYRRELGDASIRAIALSPSPYSSVVVNSGWPSIVSTLLHASSSFLLLSPTKLNTQFASIASSTDCNSPLFSDPVNVGEPPSLNGLANRCVGVLREHLFDQSMT